MDTLQRAKKIKMFVFDVDGTLTDGSVNMSVNGEVSKIFNVKDGLGITLALQNRFKVVFITGRVSEILLKRAQELCVEEVYQGIKDKVAVLNNLCLKYDIDIKEIAFMGDDLNDFRSMQLVGLACAPHNAAQEVKEIAHYITEEDGGQGAARAFIRYVLKSQDMWQQAVQSYVNKGYGVQ